MLYGINMKDIIIMRQTTTPIPGLYTKFLFTLSTRGEATSGGAPEHPPKPDRV